MLSVISYWEVILKDAKGKLDVGNPLAWGEIALRDFAATVLPLRPVHVAEIHGLPFIHRDPFDRLLIAQAISEEMCILTSDRVFQKYPVEVLWCGT